MKWEKLSEYERDGKKIPVQNVWKSDASPPYYIAAQPEPLRYVAFFGTSSSGRTATCLGGFSTAESAKRACDDHAASRPVGEVQTQHGDEGLPGPDSEVSRYG